MVYRVGNEGVTGLLVVEKSAVQANRRRHPRLCRGKCALRLHWGQANASGLGCRLITIWKMRIVHWV